MDFSTIAGSMSHLIGSLQFDDSTVALIALLAGMVFGFRITGWHEQLKARRARIVPSKPQDIRRR